MGWRYDCDEDARSFHAFRRSELAIERAHDARDAAATKRRCARRASTRSRAVLSSSMRQMMCFDIFAFERFSLHVTFILAANKDHDIFDDDIMPPMMSGFRWLAILLLRLADIIVAPPSRVFIATTRFSLITI